MALWNPFNLFKKKQPAEPEVTQPVVTEAPIVSEPPTESEPQVSPPSPEPKDQRDTQTPPVLTAPPIAPAPIAPPIEPAVIEPEAEQAKLQDQPTVAPPEIPAGAAVEKDSDAPSVTADVAPTEAAETTRPTESTSEASPSSTGADDRLQLPFDQQVAPRQPVDIFEKISQKPTVQKKVVQEKEESGGLTGWFRSAISKTAKVLNTDIRDLVGREGRLVDDAFLKELFTHLIKTDMGVGPASEIRDAIGKKYRARKVHLSQLIDEAKTTISNIMKQEEVRLHLADQGPTVIMVVGVNGSGKTTSIAKLASMFRQDGKSVVLGAGDTFRAAAVEQLKQWAGRIGAEIVTGQDQSDPASVAYRTAQFAKDNQIDICIVDTAGRLQTQSHLMQELSKIRRVLDKVLPGAPHETLLVLDSTAGQNAISQARGFSDAAGCTGIVLAKLDGTAKGGVAIPIRKEFDLPVKFIGFGETADAIAPFDVPRYVDALFNFGD